MHKTISIVLTLAFAGLAGCVSPQQVTHQSPDDVQQEKLLRVWNMKMSQTWGEVGKPFASEMFISDNYIDEAEWSIHNLPPGLRYDKKKGTIVGVPKASGFYIVNVAVRPDKERNPWDVPKADDRWQVEDFELRIYNQITD